MIYVTRKEHFNAAHKLARPEWSDEKNEEVKMLKNITPALLYMKQIERIQSLGVYQYKMPYSMNVQ